MRCVLLTGLRGDLWATLELCLTFQTCTKKVLALNPNISGLLVFGLDCSGEEVPLEALSGGLVRISYSFVVQHAVVCCVQVLYLDICHVACVVHVTRQLLCNPLDEVCDLQYLVYLLSAESFQVVPHFQVASYMRFLGIVKGKSDRLCFQSDALHKLVASPICQSQARGVSIIRQSN